VKKTDVSYLLANPVSVSKKIMILKKLAINLAIKIKKICSRCTIEKKNMLYFSKKIC